MSIRELVDYWIRENLPPEGLKSRLAERLVELGGESVK